MKIPPYPAVALRVQELMARRDCGLGEVAELVGADAALAADILRCANSPFYRRGIPFSDLTAAITRIGAQQVLRLLVASGLAARSQALGPLVSLRRVIWIEGLASAAVSQELARLRSLRAEEAFVLGLLHDFGKIVVAAGLERLIEERGVQGRWPLDTWSAIAERHHVQAGLVTAARWKLPPIFGEVIGAHHGGSGACADAKLLEVVRASDKVVALMFERSRVAAADLAALGVIRPEEAGAVAAVIEAVPAFVSAFETPAAQSFSTAPGVLLPEPPPLDAARPLKLSISVSVARRARLFGAISAGPDALIMRGDEPLPEKRLLEAKLYAKEPFRAWIMTESCRRDGDGFRVEIRPFALDDAARGNWIALVAGAGNP